jgi:hypothetical protein
VKPIRNRLARWIVFSRKDTLDARTEVERLFQALDEIDDLLTIVRQRWLRHAAAPGDAPQLAPRTAAPPRLAPRAAAPPLL